MNRDYFGLCRFCGNLTNYDPYFNAMVCTRCFKIDREYKDKKGVKLNARKRENIIKK